MTHYKITISDYYKKVKIMAETGRKPWRKVLYEEQGYPDNYVDKTFLDEMKKNLYTRTYDFWYVVWQSGIVSQQISSLCIFVAMFVYMDLNLISPTLLFTVSSLVTVMGYLVFDLIDGGQTRRSCGRSKKDDLISLCLVLGLIFGLSPILKDLTDSISTDTIYAMTAFMLIMNLLFHDYGASGAIVSKSASFNASIFASVCLASRLPTAWHAFVMVIFAMQLFALLPLLRRHFKNHVEFIHTPLTWMMVTGAVAFVYPLSPLFSVLLVLAHSTVTLICPMWFVKLQCLKNNIHGPWDEAIIKD